MERRGSGSGSGSGSGGLKLEGVATAVTGGGGDGKAGVGTTLFQQEVMVRIRSPEREERAEKLSLKVGMGAMRKHSKLLCVQITSEDDPFFLHSLEVSEEDFSLLKADQGILVDFSTFPLKFIELLEDCIEASATGTERFLAILNITRGDSIFSIVEANKFRHLAHLTLNFRPGNDAAIKQYLAGRVQELKIQREELTSSLSHRERQLRSTNDDLAAQADKLQETQGRLTSVERELRANNASALAEAKHVSILEVEEVKKEAEKIRSNMQNRFDMQIKALMDRNETLDIENRQITTAKYELDSKVTEISSRLGSTTGELAASKQDCVSLREENRKLDTLKHEQIKSINEITIQCKSAEQALKDKEELCTTLQKRLGDAEAHRESLVVSLEQSRSSAAGSEERASVAAAEIRKGNQIIEKLQMELREVRAKLKLQKAISKQQEVTLAEKQAEAEKLSFGNAATEQAKGALALEVERLQALVEDQRSKLAESQELLKSNHQMIQWLNGQVTEAQLGKAGGSRYTFRSSIASTVAGTPAADILGVSGTS